MINKKKHSVGTIFQMIPAVFLCRFKMIIKQTIPLNIYKEETVKYSIMALELGPTTLGSKDKLISLSEP